MPKFEQIETEISDNILTITMKRPDRLNAFTPQMQGELIDAFDHADANDDVGAIIVTGAGRAFCAGADLSDGGSTWEKPELARDGGGRLTLRIFESLKPVIAACNGPSVGVGTTMQCAMDIRLAADSARYGFVFSRRGVVPEACSSWFLPRIVGISQALEWTYSGRIFEADEALNAGFVRQIYSAPELISAARALARSFIEDSAPVSVSTIRHMMWKGLTMDHPMEAHKIDSRGMYFRGRSDDAKEGIISFLEKRAPSFPGKVSSDMPDHFPWWADRKFE